MTKNITIAAYNFCKLTKEIKVDRISLGLYRNIPTGHSYWKNYRLKVRAYLMQLIKKYRIISRLRNAIEVFLQKFISTLVTVDNDQQKKIILS